MKESFLYCSVISNSTDAVEAVIMISNEQNTLFLQSLIKEKINDYWFGVSETAYMTSGCIKGRISTSDVRLRETNSFPSSVQFLGYDIAISRTASAHSVAFVIHIMYRISTSGVSTCRTYYPDIIFWNTG